MKPEGDLLIDRKKLKDRLSLWRITAIVSLVLLLLVAVRQIDGKPAPVGGDYIAQVTVDGILLDDPKRDEMLQEIAEDKRAKALLVRFNSPGGTTVGGEELYLQLREVAKHKPVVASMRTVCASACYMAALGTDHILAREGSLTGSIGVIMQSAEISRLADKLGITPITIKAGKYKDVPSFTEPLSSEDRALVQQVVSEAYENFLQMVIKRRPLSEDKIRELANGQVFTGSQAAKNHLVDGLGGEKEALDWLKSRKISPSLDIREIEPEPEFEGLFDKLAQASGLKFLGELSVGLDGLISIWQISP